MSLLPTPDTLPSDLSEGLPPSDAAIAAAIWEAPEQWTYSTDGDLGKITHANGTVIGVRGGVANAIDVRGFGDLELSKQLSGPIRWLIHWNRRRT